MSFLLFQVATFFVYFGIKNLKPRLKLHKVKFTTFSTVNAATIILLGTAIALLLPAATEPQRSVLDVYEHNDGPWISWSGDPTNTTTITWLTKTKCDTKLLIGPASNNITEEKTGIGNTERGMFWDAEMLIRAQRADYRIKVFPIEWTEGAKTALKLGREYKIITYMLKLRWRLWHEKD